MFNMSGLASGLDTNAIVTQLMQIERQPVTRLQTRQAVEQARQQALKDVRTRMTSLQTVMQTLSDPTMWADTQTVYSSDATHLGVASTGGAAAGAYTVSVTRLASADQYTQTSANTTATADDTLSLSVGGAPRSTSTSRAATRSTRSPRRSTARTASRSTRPSPAASSCSRARPPAPRAPWRSRAARPPAS